MIDELLENARSSIIYFVKAVKRGNLTQKHYENWRQVCNDEPTNYMSSNNISLIFNGWSKAIHYAQLMEKNLEENNSTSSIQKACTELGRVPSVTIYNKWYKSIINEDKNILSSTDIIIIEGSWEVALEKAGFNINDTKRSKRPVKTQHEKEISILIKQIKFLTKRIKRTPTIYEWNTYAESHEFKKIEKSAASSNVLVLLDLTTNEHSDFSVVFSKEETILILRRVQVARPFTHSPLYKQKDNYKRWRLYQNYPTPSLKNIDELFGHWTNAILAAGILSINNRMA